MELLWVWGCFVGLLGVQPPPCPGPRGPGASVPPESRAVMVESSTGGILKWGQRVQEDPPRNGIRSGALPLLLAAHPRGQGPAMGQGSPTHPRAPGPAKLLTP